MPVDVQPEPRVIDAKRRALSRYVRPCKRAARLGDSDSSCQAPLASNSANHQVGSLSLQEAMELEQRAHVIDLERQQRSDDRKRRIGLPVKGEILSRQEMDARIWTFMSVLVCIHFQKINLMRFILGTINRLTLTLRIWTRMIQMRMTLRLGLRMIRTTGSRARTSSPRIWKTCQM